MNRRHFLAAGLSVPAVLAAESAAPDVSGELLRFGLITDAQYADAEANGERHYRATPDKLRAAVADLATRRLPFTLHLGDFIDRDFASFARLLPLLDGLGHPVRHLLGNHDFAVADDEKRRVAATLGLPHDYYTFRAGPVRFLMLDTNALAAFKNAAAPEPAAGERPRKSGVDPRQLAWLDRELAAAGNAGEIALVCGHHPLAGPLPLENAGEVLALLARHRCVKAYLNGHNHDGAYAVHDGIHCVTFRSILHRPETNAWAVVRVLADRLVIDGHGREESRELVFRA